MALIQTGETVVGIRGTLGGVTFSQNKAGAYAKAWRRPVDPRRLAQVQMRGNFGGLSAAWRGLTSGDRADWNAFAAADPEPHVNPFGVAYTISGWSCFVRTNQRRARLGLGVQSVIPTGYPLPYPKTLVLEALDIFGTGTGDDYYQWDEDEVDSNCWAVFYASVVPGPGVAAASVGERWVCAVPSDQFTGHINTALDAAFGYVRSGWTMTFRIFQRHQSGIQGQPTIATVIVA